MTLDHYVGLPYADRGRSVSGVDCWGLVCLVYAGCLGIALPSYADCYGPADAREAADIAQLVQAERGLFTWIGADPPRLYDLVLLRIGGVPCHIGICTGDGRMLHVQRGTTSWVEALDRPRWQQRIEGVYRYAR